jgi:tripartite motif-containing protein 71
MLRKSYECKSVWGKQGYKPGELSYPYALTISRDGLVYIADSTNYRVSVHQKDGQFVRCFGKRGPAVGQFREPVALQFDMDGNLYVVDRGNHCVQKFDPEGNFILKFGSFGNGEENLSAPYGICKDNDGHLLVVDTDNDRIQCFNTEGKWLKTCCQGGVQRPTDVGVTADGKILVVSRTAHQIQVWDGTKGKLIKDIGGMGSSGGQFYYPWGIDIAKDGSFVVSDGVNNRIQIFSQDGVFQSEFGAGQFCDPYGLAIDWDGSIFIPDVSNHRIQIWG